MGLTAVFVACSFLAILISSPTNAQTAPAPLLPPSPAPAPAPHFVNLADLLSVAGPFHTFLNYLEKTQAIQTFQNQANNTQQGITIFVPKDSAFSSLKRTTFSNLTQDQLKTLLLYHAFPQYYSLSDFKNLSALNPVNTFAGGSYTLNLTDTSGVIHVASTWSKPEITSSVYSTAPVAIYEVDKVLLPMAIFRTEPPLAPAPAPAPETKKPSDLAPTSGGGIRSAPKSSESSTTESSAHNICISLFGYLVMALSSGLMLIL